MIKRMFARNFKGWTDTRDVPFGDMTLFFGPNSAGKSSLIQVLLMMKQTVESPDRTSALTYGEESGSDTLVALGGFRSVVNGHNMDNRIELGVELVASSPIKIKNPSSKRTLQFNQFLLSVDVENRRGTDVVKRLEYTLKTKSGDEYSLELSRITEEADEEKFKLQLDQDSMGLKLSPGRKWPLPEPVKFYGFPERLRTDYQNPDLFLDIEAEVVNFFIKKLFYLGPLREQPRRTYEWSGSRPEDVGRKGEKTVAVLLSARSRQMKSGGMLVEKRVASWLKKLGLVNDFRLEKIAEDSDRYRVEVTTQKASSWVDLTDVGLGVSQVLPVLTMLHYVPKGSTLILEHPEIHLHPRMQSGLATAVADAVKTRDLQLIIETHSEHFLMSLQLLVAKEEFSSRDCSIYFCSPVSGGHEMIPLKLNVLGEIENWPVDFFPDRFEYAMKLHDARKAQGK